MDQDRERMEQRMLLKHGRLSGRDVLEVGCGDGRATAMMAPHVRSLTAIDPDPERLETARANVPGVDFRLGSGENLEFPDASFDTVAFTFSLHHQNPARALEEAHRVLRPGGRALVEEPSVDGEMHRFFRTFRDEDAQLAAALESLGEGSFRIESSETFTIGWAFEDNEDLYGYFFTHAKTPRTREYIGKMDALLGQKKTDRPILLGEVVTVFSLVKA